MRQIKAAKYLFAVWIILFLAENFYFGWNFTPQSETEKTIDLLLIVLLKISIGLYFAPIFTMYEKFIQRHENN